MKFHRFLIFFNFLFLLKNKKRPNNKNNKINISQDIFQSIETHSESKLKHIIKFPMPMPIAKGANSKKSKSPVAYPSGSAAKKPKTNIVPNIDPKKRPAINI